MRKITFYNMCFGDSFLIQDESNCLLVDCGSKNQGQRRKKLMSNLISAHLSGFDDKSLLITHYHSDHINMLFDLCAKGITYKYVYVRDLSRTRLQFDFSSAFSSLALYSKITHDYKTFLAWLRPRKLQTILAKGGKVIGVNNALHRQINLGKSIANILWPSPFTNETVDLFNKIEKIGDELYGLICYDDNNKVVKAIKKLYSFYDELITKSEKDGLFDDKTIEDVLRDYADDDLTEEEIDDYLKKIDVSDEAYKEASDIENMLSIVFEIDSKLLMCGDANDFALDRALQKHNENNNGKDTTFSLVKVPHHGTERYYYSKLPCSSKTIYLIPNSKQFNGSKWSIFDQYTCAASPKVQYCFSLNNSPTTACSTAQAGKCRFRCLSAIFNYLVFPF